MKPMVYRVGDKFVIVPPPSGEVGDIEGFFGFFKKIGRGLAKGLKGIVGVAAKVGAGAAGVLVGGQVAGAAYRALMAPASPENQKFLEEQIKAGRLDPGYIPGATLPQSKGLPGWVIPAVGAGALGLILMMRKKRS